MKIAHYNLNLPSSASLLMFIAFLLVVLIFFIYIRYSGGNTVRFLREAFSDPTGRADLKLLSAAFMDLTLFFIVWRGMLYNVWPPEYFIWPFMLTMLALHGLTSLDFKNALTSNPTPPKNEPVQAEEPIQG